MTLDEKEQKYIDFVIKQAQERGFIFIVDTGDGRDFETDDMYIEDLCGWLCPEGAPLEEQKKEKYYCFAEWEIKKDGSLQVVFNKYD